jgi:hypothetical protein
MKSLIQSALFIVVSITIMASAVACGKASAAPQSTIHSDLVSNECYEHHSFDSGHYVTVKPTDLCLSIQFPNKGDF